MQLRASWLAALGLAALLTVATKPVRSALPAEGQPIRTKDYSIDLYQRPVLSATRVIGIGPRPLNPRWIDPSVVLEPMRRYLEWRGHERERKRRKAEQIIARGETPLGRRQRLLKLRSELRAEEDLDDKERRRVERALDRRLRQRYRSQQRFHVLVTTSLIVSGHPEGTEWRISGSLDASRRYLGWGIGLGIWR